MNKHTERVVLITGATGGLGRVVARRFGSLGYRIVLVGTNPSRLTDLVSELNLPAEQVMDFSTDLTQPDAAGKLKQAVMDKFGRVDILLHFVGGWMGGKELEEVSADEVATMLSQHVWTTFYIAQAFITGMRQNGWGRVIVISSPVAGSPPARNLPYTLAKSGQEALLVTLAEELKYSGVTANILRVRTIDVKHERQTAPSAKNEFWTTPEEITSAIEYLCSEDGSTVNGARLPLYGGP